MSKLNVASAVWIIILIGLVPWACKRDRTRTENSRSLVASEYFRAGVASAVMVKARGLDSNVVSYEDFLAVCAKAWVASNTNDAGVIKIK